MKVGDIVILKSGGEVMTVRSVRGDQIKCEWFENKKLREHEFLKEQLEIYKEPPLEIPLDTDFQ